MVGPGRLILMPRCPSGHRSALRGSDSVYRGIRLVQNSCGLEMSQMKGFDWQQLVVRPEGDLDLNDHMVFLVVSINVWHISTR